MQKMQKKIRVNGKQILVLVYKGDKYYIAEYPFLDVATQGRTVAEALKNIKEAVETNLELKGRSKLPRFEQAFPIKISVKA